MLQFKGMRVFTHQDLKDLKADHTGTDAEGDFDAAELSKVSATQQAR
jgi:hypothetical protein